MSSGFGGITLVKVGFLDLGTASWTGGLHYLRNLLYAVLMVPESKIDPLLLIGRKTDQKLIDTFNPFTKIAYTRVFDRNSLPWFVYKTLYRKTGSLHLINKLISRHDIDVVSHARFYGKSLDCPAVSWIPDLQFLRLPDMFSGREVRFLEKDMERMTHFSNLIILSSASAAEDFVHFFPAFKHKARVLHFVSQPHSEIYSMTITGELKRKYGLHGKFFMLPNQFWKHKNHRTVFEAVNILRTRGVQITVLCTGQPDDYRNPGHMESLKEYIRKNNLESSLRLLGLIDYRDVLCLMRNSVSVINPSLFEGWSSTVEEAKSIGKNIILSDIPVHREQNPPDTVYFKPHDADELAQVLKMKWETSGGGPDQELEEYAKRTLSERTIKFGICYERIVLESLDGSSN